jgi:hypothetical protein
MRRIAPLLLLVAVVVAVALVWPRLTTHSTPSSTTAPTTSTTAPTPAPLTGKPDLAGLAHSRPALIVKVENTPDALPQWGIDRADVVYEEIVNGGITRLAAVFNSQAPPRVGPVRSVRPTDESIAWPIGGIFAYSGGAPYAVAAIAKAPVKLVDESSAGGAMYRDPTRYAPHNLYASAGALFAMASRLGAKPIPPQPLFTYATSPWTATTKGTAAAPRFTVQFPSIYPVTWTWDATTQGWDRTLFGQPIVTGTHVRVSPKNVVVMWVTYVNGVGTFASYANLTGSGPAWVYEDGRVVKGTWSRGGDLSVPISYHDAHGRPIALQPGQTWVELLNTGAPVLPH